MALIVAIVHIEHIYVMRAPQTYIFVDFLIHGLNSQYTRNYIKGYQT